MYWVCILGYILDAYSFTTMLFLMVILYAHEESKEQTGGSHE
jgi:hypothetical protein